MRSQRRGEPVPRRAGQVRYGGDQWGRWWPALVRPADPFAARHVEVGLLHPPDEVGFLVPDEPHLLEQVALDDRAAARVRKKEVLARASSPAPSPVDPEEPPIVTAVPGPYRGDFRCHPEGVRRPRRAQAAKVPRRVLQRHQEPVVRVEIEILVEQRRERVGLGVERGIDRRQSCLLKTPPARMRHAVHEERRRHRARSARRRSRAPARLGRR